MGLVLGCHLPCYFVSTPPASMQEPNLLAMGRHHFQMFSRQVYVPPKLYETKSGFSFLKEKNKIKLCCMVLQVFFALAMVGMGVSQSDSLAPDSGKAKTAAASVFALLDRKSKIDPSDESGMTLDNVKGEIELRHVSFRYPTRPDIEIFRDLCLSIHAGKVRNRISDIYT